MGYNPVNDVTAGYVSPKHKALLLSLSVAHKRKIRAELEWLIEQAASELD
jgi:hypothetical protein